MATLPHVIASLERGMVMIESSLIGVDAAMSRWKPEHGGWSLVEIIAHLADEEVEDFRTRFRMTIEDPVQDWPPIDPERFALERDYQSRDLHDELRRFVEARSESLNWLRTLDAAGIDLDVKKTHPRGDLRAGDILASWAAHDLLHVRQIIKRRFEHFNAHIGPYRTAYAGSW